MRQPVILCGLGQVGRRVLDNLLAAGVPVVVVDNRCRPEELRFENVRLIRADFQRKEILVEAGVDRARAVLILTNDDLVNVSTALMVRHLHPSVRVVVRLFNQNLIPRLGKTVANVFALSVSSLTAPLLALIALTGQAMGTFLLNDSRRQIAELTISETSALRQKTIAGTAAQYQVVVVAHFPAQGEGQFFLDVDGETRLAAGDRLVVCGEAGHLTPLLEGAEEEDLPHLRWAGWVRRTARMFLRTLGEVDLAVKVCTGVLLGVVTVSTLVFHFGMDKHVAEALYRTISVMATGADMQGGNLPEGWQKVFVSILRITGAALIAAFTAIVTNYLLRARLSGALEMRRIPDSGHIIVCGLGTLGFRLVEELSQYDQRLVVIEPKRDSRFMAAARRKKNVAIIVGDPRVLDVLRQAKAATARAVLATHGDELANLEIALLARELNPRQRVVVRLNDPHLSETLREAANIRFALSIPTLAAPAFVAALYGDRVLSVFLIQGRIMGAIELIVPADDPWWDRYTVRALAVDYHLLPVHLTGADGAVCSPLLNHRLAAGDRLIVITGLPDLERLLRREPAPANWTVVVTGCTLPARSLVVQLLREQRGLGVEEADQALDHLPLNVGADLTRGHAEDLWLGLRQEGIKAQLRRKAV